MKPHILITGGTGYIGSRLRLLFPEADCIDLERYGNPTGLPNIQKEYQSLSSSDLASYDVIIHLAAHSSVALCREDPDGAIDNNLTGFATLLSLCKGKRLLYASSSSVYNGSGGRQVTEEWAQFQPTNRYDVSKYAMDLLSQTSKVEFYSLRLGTVCGWSPNLRSDLMINRMVQDALEKGELNMMNPDVHRPILDMDDLCWAVQTMVTGEAHPGIYNVASFNTTVREVAQVVSALCHVPIRTAVLGASTYDFSIDCTKFCQTYSFTFCGRIESIVEGLLAHPPVISGGRP